MPPALRSLDYGERGTVLVSPDSESLARAAANVVLTTVKNVSSADRTALIALSGGSTPKAMGRLFVTEPFLSTMPWSGMDVFWGDERWVPLADSQSNGGEAIRGFLTHVPIPATQIHPFVTEGTEPERSAADIEDVIRSLKPGTSIPRFDLILLGMGDDGHTASLFPGTPAIHEPTRLVLSHRVEKLDSTRLTFTPPLINAAATVAFLVGGSGKADILAKVLDGPIDVDVLPSQVIWPTSGNLLWLVDEAAAANLSRNAPHE